MSSSVTSSLLLLLAAASCSSSSRITRQADDVAQSIAEETGAARQRCEEGQYDCVPFYYCDADDIITDGAGLLDVRFGGQLTENAKQSPTRTHSDCGDFLDVCCTAPHPTRRERLTESTGFKPQCGTRNQNGLDIRIDGFQNHETQFGEFPWQVAITMKNRQGIDTFVGGGSLIHPQVVLTAAHTVRKRRNLDVRLGEWDTQHATEFFNHVNIPVKQNIRHPDYNGGNLQNDVALLILTAPVDLQPHIDTICLPPVDFNPRGDCIITGWGKDAFNNGDYQTVLKSVALPVVDESTCEKALRRTRLGERFSLHDSFMCAGGRPGQDACTGDGGSALVCEGPSGNYVQVGIVSWGIGCGRGGMPGVYADVRKFTGWINEEMQKAGIRL